jgi:hypothetical protein
MTTKVPWRGLKNTVVHHSPASTRAWQSANYTSRTDIYMDPPIYLPGIDMGEIDAMSRMRDDETEASARI